MKHYSLSFLLTIITLFRFEYSKNKTDKTALLKMLKVPQGTGRIFFRFASENLHLLFFTASLRYCSKKQSLPNFFWLVKWRRQADIPKSKCYLYRLDLSSIRAKPLPFRSI